MVQCPAGRPETSFLLGQQQKKVLRFLGYLVSREAARAVPARVLGGLWALALCPQAFGCRGGAGSRFTPIKELCVVQAELLTETVLSCCTEFGL